jgi:hypothetical protein
MTDWRPVVGDVRRVHIQACQEPLCREDQGEFWESVGGHYALVPWSEWEQALDLQDSYDELLDDFNNKKAHEGMDCYVRNEELDELRAENEHLRSERDEAVSLVEKLKGGDWYNAFTGELHCHYSTPENY